MIIITYEILITYRLVSKQNVNIWQDFHHGLLEDAAEEGSRQIHAVGLSAVVGVFG
jgi:hypothetical protein